MRPVTTLSFPIYLSTQCLHTQPVCGSFLDNTVTTPDLDGNEGLKVPCMSQLFTKLRPLSWPLEEPCLSLVGHVDSRPRRIDLYQLLW